MALDAGARWILWEFSVGAPVIIGGASIVNGMLLVPTDFPNEINSNMRGLIIAFSLPTGAAGTTGTTGVAAMNVTAMPSATSPRAIGIMIGTQAANLHRAAGMPLVERVGQVLPNREGLPEAKGCFLPVH